MFAAQQALETASRASLALDCPPGIDQNVWTYEHFRLLITQLNSLITRLAVSKECTRASCPLMCCGDVQYLCASHAEPLDCPAMEYMLHTVDGATALLNSQSTFPSRVIVRQSSASHFPNLARRLYRCLSHVWRHHPQVFQAFEAETSCTARFTALIRKYGMLDEQQMLIATQDLPALRGK